MSTYLQLRRAHLLRAPRILSSYAHEVVRCRRKLRCLRRSQRQRYFCRSVSPLLMDHVALQEANEALDTIHQISQILDTGLDKETLSILIALCESGVNPEVGIVTHEFA